MCKPDTPQDGRFYQYPGIVEGAVDLPLACLRAQAFVGAFLFWTSAPGLDIPEEYVISVPIFDLGPPVPFSEEVRRGTQWGSKLAVPSFTRPEYSHRDLGDAPGTGRVSRSCGDRSEISRNRPDQCPLRWERWWCEAREEKLRLCFWEQDRLDFENLLTILSNSDMMIPLQG